MKYPYLLYRKTFASLAGFVLWGGSLAVNGQTNSGPPVIVTQPSSQEVVLGQTVTLQVTATGEAPLKYQWFFNGWYLDGSTASFNMSDTVTLTNMQAANVGRYSVTIMNDLGTTNSAEAVLTLAATNGAPGTLDETYAPSRDDLYNGFTQNGGVSYADKGFNYHLLAPLPEGKVLAATKASPVVCRLNADGSGVLPILSHYEGTVQSVAVNPSGAFFISVAQLSHYGNPIYKFLPDATLDTNFTVPGVTGSPFESNPGLVGKATCMAIQPDQKLLVGGPLSSYRNQSFNHFTRLNADGTLDTAFYNATKELLPGAWLTDETLHAIGLQPDGRILLAGGFKTFNGATQGGIARLNADGTVDSTFTPGAGVNGTVNAMQLLPDGRILLGGDFSQVAGQTRNRLARLNADGSLDLSFNPGTGPDGAVNCLDINRQGAIVVGGAFANFNGVARNSLAKLNPDGSLQSEFDPGTGIASSLDRAINALLIQDDGRVLIGGVFSSVNGVVRYGLARVYDVPIPLLNHHGFSPESGFHMSLQGRPGSHWRIQTSTNLNNWQDWTNLTLETSTINTTDIGGKDAPSRFYRAIQQDGE